MRYALNSTVSELHRFNIETVQTFERDSSSRDEGCGACGIQLVVLFEALDAGLCESNLAVCATTGPAKRETCHGTYVEDHEA